MSKKIEKKTQIEFHNVGYIYAQKSPFEYEALKDINLSIKDKCITAIVGSTGSGKSTLIQHINGLLIPTSGEVHVSDFIIKAKQRKIKKQKLLRKNVGLVFQFPEYQLFEETIEKDIMFGPINLGEKKDVAKKNAQYYLKLVGLSDEYLSRSPFDLSGGQKRRVAIAGILAIKGHTLILDEPTAGLDPVGEDELIKLFNDLNKNDNRRIILVTHNMDHVLKIADEVVVLKGSTIYKKGSPFEIFSDQKLYDDTGIEPPKIFRFLNKLKLNGFNIDNIKVRDNESLIKELALIIKEKNND